MARCFLRLPTLVCSKLSGLQQPFVSKKFKTRCCLLSTQSRPPMKEINSQSCSNDLLSFLNQQILATGPIPVPIFTNICLHHPTLGYYSRSDRGEDADPFGLKGDFITSPEISQVFGEVDQLIAVWMVSRWQAAGSPAKTRLIELGPGRGTLMVDLIRTLKSIKSFDAQVTSVHLVERSQFMRELQKQRLREMGWGDEVHWYEGVNEISKDKSNWTMVIAHEFFDALPIHIFQKTEKGFREVLVDIENHESTLQRSTSSKPLRFVLSPTPTLASQTLINSSQGKISNGSKVEISPSSFQVASQMAKVIKSNSAADMGGAGLVIDYGNDHFFGNSLRGFYRHRIADPLSKPGLTDITSNVDFSNLRRAMDPHVSTYGPITQRDFLLSMGIEVRVKRLGEEAKAGSERLVDKLGMGNQYKFLAFESSSCKVEEVYPFISHPKN
ncbi:S-adenosyl-L-methionine-dependent methyltransferase [Phakopsora pachyrhizi]|uniref:Protein arginine methyltransferase NDUFAF7 n=1 Tax=Phakopsora pachyrhizi TaxID=170000 RepID=A0AAV0BIP1_PHAPC|nr:S-adenosyl-L-methionine-dependent methyltransferase [Phakopsora pachyrhizi]